ncbi:carboxypeptidase-like regulatory domain-containing protein [Paenibacillus planticolens]|uniref:Atrophied bacterial Ig domain-containing protein n=1 Tax=Paenibacillus planticolens TaxID=2654976 RepID=A0ABX1ZJF5_9BACL|nr:carboxypeptidase-like regulatory domain-containing protein [Paenibacillus planticolens]NOV00234.1 hypothetical protein [Paenibacillus planticolens]
MLGAHKQKGQKGFIILLLCFILLMPFFPALAVEAASGGSISGKITDTNQNPLAQASITVFESTYGAYQFVKTVQSNADGNYEVNGLASNTYSLQVRIDGFVADNQSTVLVMGNQQVTKNYALSIAGAVSGSVTDPQGVPVSQATVFVHDSNYSYYDSAYTDSKGNFWLATVPPGLVTVEVTASGYARESVTDVQVRAQETTQGLRFQLQPEVVITGNIKDESGAPISGVYVSGYNEQTQSGFSSQPSDVNGAFRLGNLVPGTYTLSVNARGYAREQRDNIVVTAGTEERKVDFILRKAGSVTGKITNTNGAPIEGVNVMAYDALSNRYQDSAQTDASGTYSLDALPTGSYRLEAYKQGYTRAKRDWVEVNASSANPNADFVLQQGASLSGMVTDELDHPIAGANVYASGDRGGSEYVTTDSSGRFHIAGLSDGIYTLDVTANGYISGRNTRATISEGQDQEGIRIKLAPAAIISGKVTSNSSIPLKNASIMAFDTLTHNGYGQSIMDDGRYMLGMLPEGTYDVTAEADGYLKETISGIHAVIGQEHANVNFNLKPSAIIEGTVTDEQGQPLRDIRVIVKEPEKQMEISSSYTDSSGHFSVSKMPSGTYTVETWSEDYLPDQRENVNVAIGTPVTGLNFALVKGGIIMGAVTDGSGNPLEGVQVSANSEQGFFYKSEMTNSQGIYLLRGLREGSYQLSTWKSGYPSYEKNGIVVDSRGTTAGINFVFSNGGRITGTVTDIYGNPLSDVEIGVFQDHSTTMKSTLTDNKGEYGIDGIPSGTYKVRATKNKYMEQTLSGVDVVAGETKSYVNFQMQMGGTVSGIVRDPSEAPLKAKLTISDGMQWNTATSTDSEGRFKFEGLPAGIYTVSADAIGYFSAWLGNIWVSPDQETAKIVITPIKAATVSGLIHNPFGSASEVQFTISDKQGSVLPKIKSYFSNDSYTLSPLEAGSYMIKAIVQNNGADVIREKAITVLPGQDLGNINLDFGDGSQTGGAIKGTVLANGIAVSNASVFLVNDRDEIMYQTRTGTLGEFHFGDIKDGSYNIRIYAQGYQLIERRDIVVEQGKMIDLQAIILLEDNSADIQAINEDWMLLTEDAIKADNPLLSQVTSNLNLPKKGQNGTDIAWVSSISRYLLPDGTVHRPSYTMGAIDVTLVATLSKGSADSRSKSFEVKVIALDMTDEEAIHLAIQGFNQESIKGNNISLDEIVDHLILPAEGLEHTAIAWRSSHPDVISNQGIVNRPAYTTGNTAVTLTAAVSRGTAAPQDMTLKVVVKRQDMTDAEAVVLTLDGIQQDTIKGGNINLLQITSALNLPQQGIEGTDISWLSSMPVIVQADGTVTRPSFDSEDAAVQLTAIARRGTEQKQKIFQVLVKKKEPTDEEAVNYARNQLNEQSIAGDNSNLSTVIHDLKFAESGSYGTHIVWTSEDLDVIAANGKVTRPAFGGTDRTVKITASISRGEFAVSQDFTIVVRTETDGPFNLTVEDMGGSPLGSAMVLIRNSNKETILSAVTDAQGVLHAALSQGEYEVDVYRAGFQPVEQKVKVVDGQKTFTTVKLTKASLIEGKMTVDRMTLEQIKQQGIDPNDSRNQYVYQFTTRLATHEVSYAINGMGDFVGSGSEGGSNGGGVPRGIDLGDGRKAQLNVFPVPGHPEIEPSVAYLIIPGEVRSLKEFFMVELVLWNSFSSAFSLDNATATLSLPEGLSLAPTATSQSLDIHLGSIPGSLETHATWILRGDLKGEYKVSADFEAQLSVFHVPVTAHFVTDDAIKVYAGDAYRMHITAEKLVQKGLPYLVRFEIENMTDAPIYRLRFQLKEASAEAGYTSAYSGQLEPRLIDELAPYDKAIFDYLLVPLIDGELDLTKSFVTDESSGTPIPVTIDFVDQLENRMERGN